jgi:hypothetical protein
MKTTSNPILSLMTALPLLLPRMCRGFGNGDKRIEFVERQDSKSIRNPPGADEPGGFSLSRRLRCNTSLVRLRGLS